MCAKIKEISTNATDLVLQWKFCEDMWAEATLIEWFSGHQLAKKTKTTKKSLYFVLSWYFLFHWWQQ